MKRGFTLVEISIVLIIIGLLVTGIMLGQSLVTAAQNHAIISDFVKYQTAANSYNTKYRAWPGDDDGASRWTGATNGDGNGQLPDPAITTDEYYQFWLHLLKAGLINGDYNGAAGSVPLAPLDDYYITHCGDSALLSQQAFLLTLGNTVNGYGSKILDSAVVIKAIDRKIDDGILSTGIVMGYGGFNPTKTCTDSTCYGIIYVYKTN